MLLRSGSSARLRGLSYVRRAFDYNSSYSRALAVYRNEFIRQILCLSCQKLLAHVVPFATQR